MEKEHRCEAMDKGALIVLSPSEGKAVLALNGEYGMPCVFIRFCPFCGEELAVETEAGRAARVARAAEIAKPDSNDPDDDPYDRPWEE
jgi:hypothetical protein